MLKRAFGSVICAAFLTAAGPANAVLTVYSDFVSWAGNSGGLVTTETFESFDFTDPANSAQAFVDFNFFESFGNLVAVAQLPYTAGDFIGVSRDFAADAAFLDSNYIAIRSPRILNVELPDGARAFGFNFAEQHGKAIEFEVQVNTVSGINSFRVNSDPNAYAFFGAVADEEIVSFNFTPTSSSLEGDYGVLDNVSVGQLPPIPEPDTSALTLSGLALLGFVVRRRRVNAR